MRYPFNCIQREDFQSMPPIDQTLITGVIQGALFEHVYLNIEEMQPSP